MRVAFYAPLKPPTFPVPSGDRQMARQLIAALEAADHEVEIASSFRSRDGAGDIVRQMRLMTLGGKLARRVASRFAARPAAQRPDAWLTYHVYHKAPDWIGPLVCDSLDIPYVIAEASYAPKRKSGAWAVGHRAAAAAIRRADVVIGLNSIDAACVRPLLSRHDKLHQLRPFTDVARFGRAGDRRQMHRDRIAAAHGLDSHLPLLLAVGMMRDGDKLQSYRDLGRALALLTGEAWQLLVVGDGDARRAVEAALAPLGADRVRFAGVQPGEAMPGFYAASDILVWPARHEAYGVSILEAQATGLPVVAGDAGGVSDIVCDGETGTLTAEGDAQAFADAVRVMLGAPDRRAELGAGARVKMARDHSVAAAAAALDKALSQAVAA